MNECGSRENDDVAFLCYLYRAAGGGSLGVVQVRDDGSSVVPPGTLFAAARRLETRGCLEIVGQKPGELLLRVTHLGILLIEEHASEVVGMDDVRGRQAKRSKFLRMLYEETVGSDEPHAVAATIGAGLGLLPEEVNRIAKYWEDHGALEVVAYSGDQWVVRLTSEGVDEAENLIKPPESGTRDAPGASPTSPIEGLVSNARSSEAANVFRKTGEAWAVRYAGEEVIFGDTLGMAYLSFLVAHPHESYTAVQLFAVVQQDPIPARWTGKNAGPAGIASEGLTFSGPGDAGPVADHESVEAARRELQNLREEIDEAREWNDSSRLERLMEEREKITAYLVEAVGLRGRHRRADDRNEMLFRRVSLNIRRGLERVRTQHPKLHAHLRGSVQSSTVFSYTPELPTDWETC